MRMLSMIALAVVASIGVFYAAVIIASESGEVVVLRTGSGSDSRTTRLWVVDHGDSAWVRSGHSEKAWFRQIEVDPSVELDRAGTKTLHTAVPVHDPQISQAVSEAFRRKYGHADWFVALSGDAAQRIVVRLD